MLSMEEMFQLQIVYHYTAKNCVVKKDITYQEIESGRSKMDIYYAASNEKKPAPTVIFVHGEMRNTPNLKDAGEYTSLGNAIASAGMNAIAFNHRVFSDGTPIKDVVSDVQNLISYVIEHADKLGIDANRIALWSFSGGGPYGLYVGLSGMFPSVRCLVNYYGFADFEVMKQCLSDGEVKKGGELVSPISLISPNKALIPPILMVRAGLDAKVLNDTIDSFTREALRNNLDLVVYNHPTGHHAFDIFDDNEKTQEIMERTIEFLKYQLFK